MKSEKQGGQNKTVKVAVFGGLIVAVILILTTVWTGSSSKRSTEQAVHSVSNFYLRELAGRREQVVASNLTNSIKNMRDAIDLMDGNDLSDMEHLQAFQARMKKLYTVEKFAFVDTSGLIYTSLGTLTNIDEYDFDYNSLSEPKVSIKDMLSADKKVVIAVPIDRIPFNGETLVTCFMEIDMDVLLDGLSLQSDANGTTFCNLYARSGLSLTNVVLGGLSREQNLLDALKDASFRSQYSYDQICADFESGREGAISFKYNNVDETMYYIPVSGTDWMLTYLIQEGLISNQISSITRGITTRSLLQSLLIVVFLLGVFLVFLYQTRKNNAILLEKEKAEAESRGKRQELEERLRLQDQLLEQERQNESLKAMHRMLNSGPWFMDFDEHGELTSVTWSDTFRRMIGYESTKDFPDDLEAWSSLLHKDDKDHVMAMFRDTIRDYSGQKTYDAEYRLLTKDRGWRWFHAIGQLTRRPDGTPITYIGIFIDITREKELERTLSEQQEALKSALAQAQEANAAKTSFLSSMSHEIRTPMNAIIGLDSIALKDPNLPERTRDQLEKIGGSARHLLSLINDILDMSRIESGRMTIRNEEFSFREMLEQINTMINGQCQEKGLSYDCRLLSRVDDYYIGDDMKLKQVIINILGNAVKFTPAGGKVTFSVEQVTRFEDKATMRFVMADTGIGMDKDFLPRIFDAFSQEEENRANKYGSTGLGMAITKNIVEMMNGDITVDSEKGVGTTFAVTVTLRISDRKALERDIRPQDLKVLIIDDDPVDCEHARLVLDEVGIVSDSCLGGTEAIEMLRVAHARREPYNLILVDLRMPEQDGVEVTRRIRELYADESAIVILTAYNWDDILEEAIRAGVDGFMAKPLFASGVLDEFKQAIQRKSRSGEEKPKADLKGRRILLAEDIEMNAEIMTDLLEMEGIETDHAKNGRLALEMFRDSPEGTYDAILMDVRMPVMNGLEATTAIRALDRPEAKRIPIIALTANALDEDVQRSLQVGMNAHLSKPVDPEQLYETLRILIAAHLTGE
ncbi:MAG: response regulator [Oscillospiraceae bacterium]|nr:response regulator [Oscillospiraceae bacterium]